MNLLGADGVLLCGCELLLTVLQPVQIWPSLQVALPDGVWATPALHKDVVYVPTDYGNFYALDRYDGSIRWQTRLTGPVWSSPSVVDDVLIQGDCAGTIHAWDVADTDRDPKKLWTIGSPWCVESTPAIFDGQIVVGHRRGEIVAIG